MKKIFLIVLVLLSNTLTAQSINPSVGVSALLDWTNLTERYDAGNNKISIETLYGEVQTGLFAEITYAELFLGAGFAVTRMANKVQSEGGNTRVTTETSSNLELLSLAVRVLGKYPFTTDIFQVAPLLGFEYDFCIGGKLANTDLTDTQKQERNDLYLLAGVQGDWDFTKPFFLRAQLLGGLNLLPAPANDQGHSFMGWRIQTGISLGYHF